MTYFTLLGRLKLHINNEGSIGSKTQVQNKGNLCSRSGFGVVGFNEYDAKPSGYSMKVGILASKGDGTKYFDENVDYRAKTMNYFDDDFYVDVDDGDGDLSCFRGLVLDIAYRPINVVCWKRAICLEFTDKADVLEYYDQTVNSPSGSFNIPAVLRVPHLLQVVKRKRVRNTLSRKNIFNRDDYMCQYCYATNSLTVDHVIPVSRGGKWEWENLVTACSKCNSKKGQKTLEEANMTLMKVPKAPKQYDILAIPLTSAALRMLKIRKGTPPEWHQYLP